MSFKDLGDFVLDGAAFKLPLRGRNGTTKTYTIPPVPADVGLRAQTLISVGRAAKEAKDSGNTAKLSDADREVLSDLEERNLYRDLLGTAFDQIVKDGVPWAWLKHAAVTVMIDCATTRESAEKFWASPGKRPAPTDRKPTKRAPSARSRSTAAAGTTKPPASTSGTTSRRS